MKTLKVYYLNYNLFEKDLLQNLIRIFNDEVLDDMPGDTFGQIYEYFLNNFAQVELRKVVNSLLHHLSLETIVNIIEPNHGIILDPAVGSAGCLFKQHILFKRKDLKLLQKLLLRSRKNRHQYKTS